MINFMLIYPKNLTEFDAVKVMTPEISNHPNLTIDTEGIMYHTTKVYSFVFQNEYRDLEKAIFGILNSSMLWFFIKNTGYVLRGGFYTFKTEYLKPFPIPNRFKEQQKPLINLVNQMLELNKKLAAANVPQIKDALQRQIEATDKQIDQLVYKLYDLTDEEIKIVES